MGWLSRLFNCQNMASKSFADKNTRSRPMEITFHYGDTTKYSKEEKIERVKTFIIDSFNREPWHLKSEVRIRSIDDDKCIISVDTLIDKDHPYSYSGYNKLRMELTHIFENLSSSTYLPFIEKYGLDFYSKVSRLIVNIDLNEHFQLKPDAYIHANQHHRLDFTQKLWDHVRSHLKDNIEVSECLKEIDYDRVRVSQNFTSDRNAQPFILSTQIIVDQDETPILTNVNDVVEELVAAITELRNHPYLIIYTEGTKHRATVLIENL